VIAKIKINLEVRYQTEASWITINNPVGTNNGILNIKIDNNNSKSIPKTASILIIAENSLYSPQIITINYIAKHNICNQNNFILDSINGSISSSSDYVIIGNPGDNNNTGAAYIYKRDGNFWTEDIKLDPPKNEPESIFGRYVAISINYAVISYNNALIIYKKEQDNWSKHYEIKCITTPKSVSMNDNYIMFAVKSGDLSVLIGQAYIYKRNGESWSKEVELIEHTDNVPLAFGSSVSINQKYAVIGDSFAGIFHGTVYVSKNEGDHWIDSFRLQSSDR